MFDVPTAATASHVLYPPTAIKNFTFQKRREKSVHILKISRNNSKRCSFFCFKMKTLFFSFTFHDVFLFQFYEIENKRLRHIYSLKELFSCFCFPRNKH